MIIVKKIYYKFFEQEGLITISEITDQSFNMKWSSETQPLWRCWEIRMDPTLCCALHHWRLQNQRTRMCLCHAPRRGNPSLPDDADCCLAFMLWARKGTATAVPANKVIQPQKQTNNTYDQIFSRTLLPVNIIERSDTNNAAFPCFCSRLQIFHAASANQNITHITLFTKPEEWTSHSAHKLQASQQCERPVGSKQILQNK